MILIQRGKIKKKKKELEAKLTEKKKINKNGWCGKLGVIDSFYDLLLPST